MRTGQTCQLHDMDFSLTKEYGKKVQVLTNIKKIRNHYLIEPAEIEKLVTMTPEEKKTFMSKDVDQQYAETGEQLNEPIDTFEKIYLIVRNITNRNVKQEYVLKKHDIIKLGRVKFKVKQIYIKKNEEERARKQRKLQRREAEWYRKELKRLRELKEKNAKNKRANSAKLDAIIAEMQKEADGKPDDNNANPRQPQRFCSARFAQQ